ncbi:carboxypeptidase-like regulatory domain-containing protein [Flagellimonas eckloniae]|uniref:TonB-dependent receptor n=1 Tax=Flagellimonas eckloniae TaxID=346185 RepID=A0A0Q1BKA9_9FLAO|nr:carboxypeptidase-like regulatory domain-containing protein [Allomuricauda eckloniae]KQC31108.1 hypothetical protein AAY42_15320 [Allomuricauda eckloniae]
MKTRITFLFFFLMLNCSLLAQNGIVSGTLLDKDGTPLAGVSITVKGKNNGTQSDFDGNYSINCGVGDTLIFTYIGFSSKEIKVTAKMFNNSPTTEITKNTPVASIISNDYAEQLSKNKNLEFDIPDIGTSNKTFTLNQRYFNYSQIKKIDPSQDDIKIKIYAGDIHFEIGVDQKSSFQFVQQRNLPETQNLFAQGRANNGSSTWFGPETDEIFSYGPRLTNLEFDGQSYPFDVNGRLVGVGQGNGTTANAYDNPIFETGLNTYTTVNFHVASDKDQFKLNYANGNTKDLFNKSGNKTNHIDLGYVSKGDMLEWDASVQYHNSKIGNANINGHHNQIYFGQLITPPSFSNGQAFALDDGTQRSFSPQNFNNPYWLLKNNGNMVDYSFFKASLINDINFIDNLNIDTGITFSKQSQEMRFDLPFGTNGFENGYLSDKLIHTEEISFDFSASHWNIRVADGIYLAPYTSFNFTNSRLQYGLLEASAIQTLNTLSNEPKKSTVQLKNRVTFETDFGFDMWLTLQNNSFSSSVQGNEWFLPSAKLYVGLGNNIFDSDFINHLSLSGGFSKDVVDFPLFYDNLSHNSLQLDLEDSLTYTTNNDLFISDGLDFEMVEQFDFETKATFFNHQLDITVSYYNSLNKNSIFPFFGNNGWQLQNIGEIRNKGLEASIDFHLGRYYDSGFKVNTKIIFSKNRPIVENIYGNTLNRIPIAGFQTITKNLIIGQPVGTLVGNAFLRNENNAVVVGDDGFPLVDPELQILGNPVPDFNLGWSNTLSLGGFKLSFLLDYQRGGDIWNGTQNILNYFGASQESAQLRETTGFIFQGVDQQGNTNSIPVDFASVNSNTNENRWARYGFGGVAEEAISDGSYLNLKSISFSYKIKNGSKDSFFKEAVFGVFAKNIWTWTKTQGVNPYGTLYGNTSAQGLHFFNLPLASEIGANINIKI